MDIKREVVHFLREKEKTGERLASRLMVGYSRLWQAQQEKRICAREHLTHPLVSWQPSAPSRLAGTNSEPEFILSISARWTGKERERYVTLRCDAMRACWVALRCASYMRHQRPLAYTSENWAYMIEDPQLRTTQAIRALFERRGRIYIF